MRKFIDFFWTRKAFIIFLFLEIWSVNLIIRHNYYHNTIYTTSSNSIAASFNKVFTSTTDYLKLKQKNELLAYQNELLLNNLFASYDNSEYNSYFSKFEAFNSKVISNSIYKTNNYITIDIGKSGGIKDEMGVITPSGVVGIIYNSSENYSVVYSLLNKQTTISSKIKKNGVIGTCVWKENDPQIGIIQNIPVHIDARIGDTIVTSGYSSIFPPNIPIGIISKVTDSKDDAFLEIEFKYAVDFSSLNYVLVINNIDIAEIDSLQNNSYVEDDTK